MTDEIPIQALVPRAKAAAIDILLIGMICFALEWLVRVADPPRMGAAKIFEILLALIAAVELFTGRTPGKLLAGIILRNRGGQSVSILSLVIRGIIRLLPVVIFLPSLYVADSLVSLTIWGVSLSVVCIYICAAYLALMRVGTSPFDMVSGTIVTSK